MNGPVASRYAAALADVALEQNIGDRVRSELRAFVDTFSASDDLRNFIESPAIDLEVKHKVIEELAERMDLAPAVRNFLYVLVNHRRTEMLHDIQKAFETELNARLGIVEAEVTSTRELNAAEKQRLTQALERRTGKKIEARFGHDPSLVGGAVVRVGSTVYDGSVREQLMRLREQLEAE